MESGGEAKKMSSGVHLVFHQMVVFIISAMKQARKQGEKSRAVVKRKALRDLKAIMRGME